MSVSRKKVFVYGVIVALLGVFGLGAWLASEGRFLEAISVLGVATTLAWFVVRSMDRDG